MYKPLPDLNTLLEKHKISRENYDKTGLRWEELTEIDEHYRELIPSLEPSGPYVVGRLLQQEAVHSLRFRMKDPTSLIVKIIRKKIDRPLRNITLETYTEEIRDLVGVRVLHLVQEDWPPIHDFIVGTWPQKEKPLAYIKPGDNKKDFKDRGCKVDPDRQGYRSVHYVITLKQEKRKIYVEIQVRTIISEAWAELDHRVRYPNNMGDHILAKYLFLFSNLATFADQMGSFVGILAKEREEMSQGANITKAVEESIVDVQAQINALPIPLEEKKELEERVQTVVSQVRRGSGLPVFPLPDFGRFAWINPVNIPPSFDVEQMLGAIGGIDPKQVLGNIGIINPKQIFGDIGFIDPKQMLGAIGGMDPRQMLGDIGFIDAKKLMQDITGTADLARTFTSGLGGFSPPVSRRKATSTSSGKPQTEDKHDADDVNEEDDDAENEVSNTEGETKPT
ncbi:MAG TPA: hypothetical protein VJ183_17860 [Chloroflexia bacterium]|nr:hypothetical protein [Chloroflexia bacterium]